ncbi:C40 family peptidase [Paraconexibacter antarcticus]|uniref:C40 family peptidase n=1 Tax=Paraconexibacter antarcticus TaxID=2949664 RepID=A0ABY5DY32_9ACTN|nr:C40 family peptidase [Paraconexibacter antarcticus]UTI66061.1 C40 family peptidase [Paraconexibacter antarcticus]
MKRLAAPLLAAALLLAPAAPASAHHRHHSSGEGAGGPSEVAGPVLPVSQGADPAGQTTTQTGENPGTADPLLPDPGFLPPVAVTTTTLTIVKGRVAKLRTDGLAAVPHDAPAAVRAIIRAANTIVGKPYKWGGGHARLRDTGYDCSGAVSYALIEAGQLGTAMVSGDLAKTFAAGAGRHVSVYANAGHVYMEVAGLRFDTSPVGDPGGRDGVRWRPVIGRRAGFHARHPVGL